MTTLEKQRARLERKLSKRLMKEARDTLSAILKNEDKQSKKTDTSLGSKSALPFNISELQIHLLDEDGEGMVLWLQGSIEKGKIHIEKGFEELTDMEAIEVELEEHDPYDDFTPSEEEEDAIIEEMFTTAGKKPVLLN